MNKSRKMIHASRLLDLLREMKNISRSSRSRFQLKHRKKTKSTFFAGSCIFCQIVTRVDYLMSVERSDDDDDADAEVSREGVDTETAESAVRCQS